MELIYIIMSGVLVICHESGPPQPVLETLLLQGQPKQNHFGTPGVCMQMTQVPLRFFLQRFVIMNKLPFSSLRLLLMD